LIDLFSPGELIPNLPGDILPANAAVLGDFQNAPVIARTFGVHPVPEGKGRGKPGISAQVNHRGCNPPGFAGVIVACQVGCPHVRGGMRRTRSGSRSSPCPGRRAANRKSAVIRVKIRGEDSCGRRHGNRYNADVIHIPAFVLHRAIALEVEAELEVRDVVAWVEQHCLLVVRRIRNAANRPPDGGPGRAAVLGHIQLRPVITHAFNVLPIPPLDGDGVSAIASHIQYR